MFPVLTLSQESEQFIEYPAQLIVSDTLVIKGSFDGNPENTFLNIGDQSFNAVSETLEHTAFSLQNSKLGAVKATLVELTFEAPLQLQLIKLNTSLSNSNLKRGSKSILQVEVTGVSGSESDIKINVINRTPSLIKLEGGDEQLWSLPSNNNQNEASKKYKITAIQLGNFNLKVELKGVVNKFSKVEQFNEVVNTSDQSEEKEKEDIACGYIYGKVENKLGGKVGEIVVFVEGECDLCPPAKKIDSITITNDCFKYEPSWAVVPKGTVITVKNTSKIECHIKPYLSTKFKDKTGFEETLEPGGEKSFVAKEYLESDSGNPRGYGISDLFHKHADMSIFIAPNSCYCTATEEGNYEIGELPPGSYTLKVYTKLSRSNTPSATVIVKSNERTRQDFELNKEMRQVKQKSN